MKVDLAPTPRLALNAAEAAEALGVSVKTFQRHIQGKVPTVYVGSRRIFPVPGLAAWLKANAEIAGDGPEIPWLKKDGDKAA